MEYFRKYLIFLRRQENLDDSKLTFSMKLLIASITGFVTGVILDSFLPFNFVVNMFRGLVANATAIVAFSFIYLFQTNYIDRKKAQNRHYRPLRKRLSYRQRLNASIAIGLLTSVLVLFNGNPSPLYTFKAVVAIVVIVFLISFTRKDRNEFLKSIYEIPDVRDMRFDSDRKANEKIKEMQDKEKKEKDKLKKENKKSKLF